jgi:hypothetical protein
MSLPTEPRAARVATRSKNKNNFLDGDLGRLTAIYRHRCFERTAGQAMETLTSDSKMNFFGRAAIFVSCPFAFPFSFSVSLEMVIARVSNVDDAAIVIPLKIRAKDGNLSILFTSTWRQMLIRMRTRQQRRMEQKEN